MMIPLLIVLSMALGIWGGRVAGVAAGILSLLTYTIQDYLQVSLPYNVFFALIKGYTFSFINFKHTCLLWLLRIRQFARNWTGKYKSCSGKLCGDIICRLCFSSTVITMIEVRNIKKSFNGNVILNDVTAKMEAGRCNLIIGASGSGKTVFMKCLVGLFQPDSGEIIYDGQSFTAMPVNERKDIRKQIGMLFRALHYSTA